MKKAELTKVAKELNELFGLDPAIDITKSAEQVNEKIKEAMLFLQNDDDLTDNTIAILREIDLTDENLENFITEEKISKKEKTILLSTLQTLGIWINEEEKEKEKEEEEKVEDAEVIEDDDLKTEIESATKLSELKIIAKSNDEFKSIRSGLTKYKEVEELQEALMDILSPGTEKEPEEKATIKHPAAKKKTEEKPAAEKAPAKAKTGKTETFEVSVVNPKIKRGSKVKFTTSPNHKECPSTELTGKVVKIFTEARNGKEYIRISNNEFGIFHKVGRAVTITK